MMYYTGDVLVHKEYLYSNSCIIIVYVHSSFVISGRIMCELKIMDYAPGCGYNIDYRPGEFFGLYFEDDVDKLFVRWEDAIQKSANYRRAGDSVTVRGHFTTGTTKHKCNCDKYQVINFGCKCGGV